MIFIYIFWNTQFVIADINACMRIYIYISRYLVMCACVHAFCKNSLDLLYLHVYIYMYSSVPREMEDFCSAF